MRLRGRIAYLSTGSEGQDIGPLETREDGDGTVLIGALGFVLLDALLHRTCTMSTG